MYTVDLHQKFETVQTAESNLLVQIKLARKTKEKALCLIVGYGSSGGTHKIRTAILQALEDLSGKEWIDKDCLRRKNKGEIIVIL